MCGITGFFQEGASSPARTAQIMADSIAHRGPDDSGVWCDESVGIAFGFRRLSIVDLTPNGHQPMASASGRFHIVFNGEIYNFLELKQELSGKGNQFRGGSDTEVMLAAFETWGIRESLLKFNGMFAFAVWDSKEQQLSLARDRIGKKPLYYGWCNGCFIFGSELKAVKCHPRFGSEIDRSALKHYMQRGYIPSPFSIYRDFHKLVPGALLEIPKRDLLRRPAGFSPSLVSGAEAGPVAYWDLVGLGRRSQAQPFQGSELDAVNELDRLLGDSIRRRMVADVPIGAFFSGGIDSSLVVAMMQAEHSKPVQTFTIGFHEADYDEAPFARRIAEYLKTDHTELYISADEGLSVIPDLPSMYDEPLADASQIPTYIVSRLARSQVTVALCGDGGDELFIGYNRYTWPKKIFSVLKYFPLPLRQAIGRIGLSLSPPVQHRLAEVLASAIPRVNRPQRSNDSLQKLFRIMSAHSQDEIYEDLTTYWPANSVIGDEFRKPQYTMGDMQMLSDFLLRSMFLDLGSYLPGDLLAKVDRASMAASIEVRSPLLDCRVIEFAASLPSSMRAPHGVKKHLLQALLSRYVPRELFERPKMGFSVPIGGWLAGPLKGWAEDLLDESLLKREGFFDPVMVRARWKEQCAGACNWQNELWTVLMFQSWNHAQGGSK
jgi:asparagine synthase (glutamine-hydrolysing)